MIRAVFDTDISAIVDIYNYYIEETIATFEEQAITTDDMHRRITKVSGDNLPWLVAEDDSGQVIGYAYACKWRERFAYRFSVEITVYLSVNHAQQGLGTQLYTALFDELKSLSINTVIGGISLPNPASIALHEKFGLKQVAHFKEVGFKFGQWLDTGYWQGKIR
jgi:phosphinothricin acetyltransferase